MKYDVEYQYHQRAPTKEYADGWDRIWGKKTKKEEPGSQEPPAEPASPEPEEVHP